MNTSPTVLQMLVGLYAYLIPLLLYVVWSTLALHDVGQRGEIGVGRIWSWTAVIFLLPFIGPLLYLAVGGARISPSVRAIAIAGGLGIYIVVLLLAYALSSG